MKNWIWWELRVDLMPSSIHLMRIDLVGIDLMRIDLVKGSWLSMISSMARHSTMQTWAGNEFCDTTSIMPFVFMPVQCGYNTHYCQSKLWIMLYTGFHAVFCLTLSLIAIMSGWLKNLSAFPNFNSLITLSCRISYSAHVGRTSLAGRRSSRSRHQTQRGQCCRGRGRTVVGQDAGWGRGKA